MGGSEPRGHRPARIPDQDFPHDTWVAGLCHGSHGRLPGTTAKRPVSPHLDSHNTHHRERVSLRCPTEIHLARSTFPFRAGRLRGGVVGGFRLLATWNARTSMGPLIGPRSSRNRASITEFRRGKKGIWST